MARILGTLLLFSLACAPSVRRYPLAEPFWEDTDRNHTAVMPDEYYSGLMADGADQMFFYPVSQAFTIPLPGEAVNVNAVDEVPNSAWFTNRIGAFDLSPEDVAKAACGDTPPLDPARGPWVVSAAKPNGANPGFFIKAADGFRYLLKFDGSTAPPRATAADVVGSKIYWAAGFFTPCNEVVYFNEDILTIDEKATAEDEYGEKVPITKDAIDKVLRKAFRLKDGRLRASASRFVPGKPLGPFTYQGTNGDDPNDLIPHEDRRELRASFLLAAWINHFDAREQNTLNVWYKDNGREYLRHYMIDFGDSFGGRWPFDQVSRRLGYSYYWDWEHVGVDLFTLGLVPRVWNRVKIGPVDTFGYMDAEHFTPSQWRPGYRNPAFARMTHRDALWMIRILSRITKEHLVAAVKTAKIADSRVENYLIQLLWDRRQKIYQEYLTQFAPLSNFHIARRKPGSPVQSLCFEDLAILTGVVAPEAVRYKMRSYGGLEQDQELGWLEFIPDAEHPHRSCAVLPIGHQRPSQLAAPGAPDDDPLRYGVVDIFIHQTRAVRPTSSLKLHFYDLGPEKGFRLVGIDRPASPVVPPKY